MPALRRHDWPQNAASRAARSTATVRVSKASAIQLSKRPGVMPLTVRRPSRISRSNDFESIGKNRNRGNGLRSTTTTRSTLSTAATRSSAVALRPDPICLLFWNLTAWRLKQRTEMSNRPMAPSAIAPSEPGWFGFRCLR